MKKEDLKLTLEQLDEIEAILMEASAYGLALEVDEWAIKYMKEKMTKDPVEAYQIAFYEWCK